MLNEYHLPIETAFKKIIPQILDQQCYLRPLQIAFAASRVFAEVYIFKNGRLPNSYLIDLSGAVRYA